MGICLNPWKRIKLLEQMRENDNLARKMAQLEIFALQQEKACMGQEIDALKKKIEELEHETQH